MLTQTVDAFLAEGCGRCEFFQTPRCKVHRWTAGLAGLRDLLRASGLTEEMKWGSPCYTLDGGNVVMITALRGSFALSFLKGSLMRDPDGLLELPGPNSQAGRLLRFHHVDEVVTRRATILRVVEEAIRVERTGEKVAFADAPEPIPDELQAALDADPALAAAFHGLTPGRRRSYVLHVGGAKQSATRTARAAACAPKILEGKGFHDR